MRVLLVHNYYQQPGGEDQVFAAEHALLSSRGVYVNRYSLHNDLIEGQSAVRIAAKTVWNNETYRAVRRIVKEDSIDILHCHNIFPLASPSIYYAAEAARVPVVQTLHNYRLLCPGATLFRDGAVCQLCLTSAFKYKAIVHACYRGNRPASATVAGMLALHGLLGTWQSKINTYIALTRFARDKFIAGGLPAAKMKVKSNFLQNDPGTGTGGGGYALFAGRLSPEKGLALLLTAWEQIGVRLPLKIAGDGPMRESVERRAASLKGVEYLGRRPYPELIELMKNAIFLVFPSEWFEGFPMTIVESLACGTPVIAAPFGAMGELIENGVNGAHFQQSSASALADCIKALSSQATKLAEMRHHARRFYEQNCTPEQNFQTLMHIYHDALGSNFG